MSRFVWALCAFALAATPVAATVSTEFQRPDALRHAINPLIGDASFVERYGTLPPPGTDPGLRVRTHLAFVHALLSKRDTSSMSKELRDTRTRNLARLRDYIDADDFPRNHLYRDQNRPCFIDDDGRICAAGYLIEQSAGRELAERINAKFQYAFLSEMESPELDRWVASSGLSRVELALIQPCYDPEFNVTIERTSELTVTIRGVVWEFCCGMSSVTFDFGEAVWRSPDTKAWGIPINISHTYAFPGAYAIKATAVSRAWCDYQFESKTWMVNVGAAFMKIAAVEVPGGPPYLVYLTTTEEIRTECLTTALVQWQAGATPQPTSWYAENGVYRTPVHSYPNAGVRTISIANNYLANCATSQTGSITVHINGVPGSAEAARVATTWGAIKAMYR